MAKGHDRVQSTNEDAQARREAGARNFYPKLIVQDGESYHIRFCEQGSDVHNFAVHPWRDTATGKWNPGDTCLNDADDGTPCPECAAGMDRKIKGVYRVIQRNRPQLRKDKDGRAMKDANKNYIVDGHKDEIVVFIAPSTTAEDIRQFDGEKWGGMMSRDWEVKKSGNQFNPFRLDPADPSVGAVPMSDADLELIRNCTLDLDEIMKPPDFAEAAKTAARATRGQAPGNTPSAPPPAQTGAAQPDNQFMAAAQGSATPAGQ